MSGRGASWGAGPLLLLRGTAQHSCVRGVRGRRLTTQHTVHSTAQHSTLAALCAVVPVTKSMHDDLNKTALLFFLIILLVQQKCPNPQYRWGTDVFVRELRQILLHNRTIRNLP